MRGDDGERARRSRNPAYPDFTCSEFETNAYVVRSMDEAGNLSDPTAAFTSGVPDTSAPDAPDDLGGTIGAGGVQLSWTTPADDVWVATYRIERDGVPIGTTWDTSFVDAAPPLGTSDYRVVAIDSYGNESGQSGEWTNELVAVPAMPPSIAGVLASALLGAAALRFGSLASRKP